MDGPETEYENNEICTPFVIWSRVNATRNENRLRKSLQKYEHVYDLFLKWKSARGTIFTSDAASIFSRIIVTKGTEYFACGPFIRCWNDLLNGDS